MEEGCVVGEGKIRRIGIEGGRISVREGNRLITDCL